MLISQNVVSIFILRSRNYTLRVFIILFATTQSPQVLCGKIGVHLQDLGTHVLRSILLDIDIGFSEIIYSFVICDVLDDLVTLLHGCFQDF